MWDFQKILYPISIDNLRKPNYKYLHSFDYDRLDSIWEEFLKWVFGGTYKVLTINQNASQ